MTDFPLDDNPVPTIPEADDYNLLAKKIESDPNREFYSGLQEVENGVEIPDMRDTELGFLSATVGKKMVMVQPPGNTTNRQFKDAIAGAYQYYLAHGQLRSSQEIYKAGYVSKASLTQTQFTRIFDSPQFRRACEVRGMTHKPGTGLTYEQDILLQILMDSSDGLSLQQKLKKAKVPMSRYRAWMKQPRFREQLEFLGRDVLYENIPNMMVQLTNKAVSGDLNAIKFAFEVTGEHDPATKNNVNVLQVMQQMMEIIQRHVTNPDQLRAIAGEMGGIANSVGGNIKQIDGRPKPNA